MTTLLLQLSDLHIREPGKLAYGRIETAPYLQRAIDSILRLPQQPHAAVITGDLTDFGRSAEYDHLRELLKLLPMPVNLMPGNHDDRDQLRRSFADHAYLGESDFIRFSVTVGDLQLIALDTINTSSGNDFSAQLDSWLAQQLQLCKGMPVIVAMHHPPFQTLIGHMDAVGLLEGATELEALIAQHPNVERVICGHSRRAIQVRFGGTIAATVPSPAGQVCLDLAHEVCPDLAREASSMWTL